MAVKIDMELLALTAVSASAVFVSHNYWACKIFSLYAYCLLTPPMLFIDDLRLRLERIWVYASLAIVIFGVSLCSALQFLINGKYLGDREMIFVDIAYAASIFYCLPLYFTFVRPPCLAAPAHDQGVSVPGGIVLAIAFLPRSIVDTVMRSKECRAAVRALSSYIALVCCTVAVAAAAAWFDLVAAETLLTYLSVLSVVSAAYCLPRFIWPELNTRRSSMILYCIIFPAAVAATYALHATGIAELKTIDCMTARLFSRMSWAFFFVAPPPYVRTILMMARRLHH